MVIPEYYLKNAEKLYHEISNLHSQLSSVPSTLEEFVRIVEVFQTAIDITGRFEVSFSYISSIHDVMNTYQIYKPISVENQSAILLSFWKKYNDAVSEFKDSIEDNTKRFQRELVLKYEELQIPIEKTKLLFLSDEVKDPTNDCD
jgi:hypothetical protein